MGMSFHKIHQDRNGFFWCASSNGLYRYDGYSFKSYKKYVTHHEPLSSDFIFDIKEGPDGDIWLATYDGGLNRWNRQKGGFDYFMPQAAEAHSLSSKKVIQLMIARDGMAWAITEEQEQTPRLDRLDPATGAVMRFRKNASGAGHLSSDTIAVIAMAGTTIRPIIQDKEGQIWLATTGGLFLYQSAEDNFRAIAAPWRMGVEYPIQLYESPAKKGLIWILTADEELRSGHIYRLDMHSHAITRLNLPKALTYAPVGIAQSADAPNVLWLSSRELFQYNLENDDCQVYTPALSNNSALWQGRRDSLFYPYLSSNGQLWVLPLGYNPVGHIRGSEQYNIRSGAYLLDAGSKELIRIMENPVQSGAAFGMVYGLSEDRQGGLWFGCGPGFYRKQNTLPGLHTTPAFSNIRLAETGETMDNLTAWDGVELKDGSVWIATFKGGLKRLDPSTRQLQHFRHDPKQTRTIGSDNVFSLYVDEPSNKLWIGHERGLDWAPLTVLQGLSENLVFEHQTLDLFSAAEPITEIAPGPDGHLWLGTTRKGLLLFNPETKQLIRQLLPGDPASGSINTPYINKVFTDRKGRNWVATGMGGLCQAIPGSDNNYTFDCHLEGMYIVDIYEAEDGRLWLAAMNYGLVLFNPENGKYQLLNMENKLRRNSVLGIEADGSKQIWFSSLGLSRFNPKTGAIHNFQEESGILDTDPGRAFLKLANGQLIYSSINGWLQLFDPNTVLNNPYPPRAILTSLQAFQQETGAMAPVEIEANIEAAAEARLSYHQQPFTLEFVGLETIDNKGITYAVKLDGYEQKWNYLGAGRTARYVNVPPGSYEFLVKASNSDGLSAVEPSRLRIVILPPWYRTNLAYLGYFLAVIGALFFTFHLIQRRWRLEARLKQEKREAERLMELDEAKTRIFTNISHEFRTPLTVITGIAERIRENPSNWTARGIEMIQENTSYLLRLVNQLLSLSKLEAGSLPTHFVNGDVILFLKNVVEPFQSLAAKKRLEFSTKYAPGQLKMDYDPDKFAQIITNLLFNALKFTDEGGSVSLIAETVERDRASHLLVRIVDTGKGIAPEKLPLIFGRFFQADDSPTRKEEGAGIGLALASELAKLLGGAITVESKIGKGSTFSLFLPIRNEAAPQVVPVNRPGESLAPTGSKSTQKHDEKNRPQLLIIEDNPDVREYLTACLEDDFTIHIAENGLLGAQSAIQLVPDIIISDIMMPELDGLELSRRLKKDERTSHIPILLLTARADAESRKEGYQTGADAYLEKPFDLKELQIRLKNLLDNRRILQERYRYLSLPEAPSNQEEQFLARAREVILKHLPDIEFGIDELCKALGMSRTQLHNKLKALTQRSTGLFIRGIRLQFAKQMLEGDPSLSISDVAYNTGFQDPNYFSRCFKAEFGKSPREIRK